MLLEGLHQKINLQAALQHKTVFITGKNGQQWDMDKVLSKGLNNKADMVVERSMQLGEDKVIGMYAGRKRPKR